MVNVYDTANKLASEIKETVEFKNLKKAKEALDNNLEIKAKVEEFEKLRTDMQRQMIRKEKTSEEVTKKMKDAYDEIFKDKIAGDYLLAEMQFGVMVTDINKIIGESIKEVM